MKNILLISITIFAFLNSPAIASPDFMGPLEPPEKILSDKANNYIPGRKLPCPSSQVTVYFDILDDFNIACSGASLALDFFVKHGIRFSENLTIPIVPEVRIPYSVDENGYLCAGSGELVAGLWDKGLHGLRVTSSTSAWLRNKDRPFFMLPYSDNMLASVVAHEVAHAINKNQYTVSREELSTAGDECIAYWLQISVLPASIRDSILEKYDDKKFSPIPDDGINSFAHAFGPHAFGVRCYRRFAREGMSLAARVYSGEFNFTME